MKRSLLALALVGSACWLDPVATENDSVQPNRPVLTEPTVMKGP